MEVHTLAVLMAVILSVGVFGNVNIIIATIRKKHLKTKIHLMICVMAVMDLISIGFELSSAIRMLLNVESMSRRTCFNFLWIYLVIYDTEMIIGLSVAFDRLVAVVHPIRYSCASAKATLPIILIFCTLIGSIPVIVAAFFIEDDIIPVCNPPLVFPRNVFFYWNGGTAVVALAIITVYLCVFVAMHRLEKTQTNIKQLQITKTLASTIIAYASTKLVAVCATFFLPMFIKNDAFTDTIATYVVLLVAVEYGINYWLLLLRKDDTYRRPFLEQLGLRKFLKEEKWASDSRPSRFGNTIQQER